MEYLGAIIIFIMMFVLIPLLTGFLGPIILICTGIFAIFLGTKSIVLGMGGVCASIANFIVTNQYIRREGAMSSGPSFTKATSIAFIFLFFLSFVLNHLFQVDLSELNYWVISFAGVAIGWLLMSQGAKNHGAALTNFYNSVTRYKIVEKYSDDPKWAVFLYFIDGGEGWSQTVPGSFCAKDPEKDFTFVFSTEQQAIDYAQRQFKNAERVF